jgi:hypothetical protein
LCTETLKVKFVLQRDNCAKLNVSFLGVQKIFSGVGPLGARTKSIFFSLERRGPRGRVVGVPEEEGPLSAPGGAPKTCCVVRLAQRLRFFKFKKELHGPGVLDIDDPMPRQPGSAFATRVAGREHVTTTV